MSIENAFKRILALLSKFDDCVYGGILNCIDNSGSKLVSEQNSLGRRALSMATS